MRSKRKLVFGVGINDADYSVSPVTSLGKQVRCGYYKTWADMLRRCYDVNLKLKYPTYAECIVCEDWKYFSKFKSWMETQDWEGKQLDKDLLIRGNKLYSPDTCVFVELKINSFLLENDKTRGQYPIGVSFHKIVGKYTSRVGIRSGKEKHLGYYHTPEEAHQAWLKAKLELAKELSNEILIAGGDLRIAKALIERYENYN